MADLKAWSHGVRKANYKNCDVNCRFSNLVQFLFTSNFDQDMISNIKKLYYKLLNSFLSLPSVGLFVASLNFVFPAVSLPLSFLYFPSPGC